MLMQKRSKSRSLILIMSAIVVMVILFSGLYYRSQNRSIDPRIVKARELYSRYNELAEQNDAEAILDLLDQVSAIYTEYDHYKNSFEIGVLENNRAAVYLTHLIAREQDPAYIDPDSLQQVELDSLLRLAEQSVRRGILIYENWSDQFITAGSPEIEASIRKDFLSGLEGTEHEEQEKYLENRVEELRDAQKEIDRRLSVAYTNLGVINRYKENYDSAVLNYRKAMGLWENNLSAENNLNHLLGKPLKKRSFLQKLFPRERLK